VPVATRSTPPANSTSCGPCILLDDGQPPTRQTLQYHVLRAGTGHDAALHALSPAALDSAIRLLDQPLAVQSFGDILEMGGVSEETINGWNNLTGGEAGIRTLGTGLSPYNGLANRRFRPLSHLTARLQVYARKTLTRKRSTAKRWRRPPAKPSPLTLNATIRGLCIVDCDSFWAHMFGHTLGHSRRVLRSVCSEDGRNSAEDCLVSRGPSNILTLSDPVSPVRELRS
jgi:hypothetical protein